MEKPEGLVWATGTGEEVKLPKPKPLECYEGIDGEPGELWAKTDKTIEYDVTLGKKFNIFIFNGNHNMICDTSKLHIADSRVIFSCPNFIHPLETVKCHIEIPPEPDGYTLKLSELPESRNLAIEGSIVWMDLGHEFEDHEKIYGWN